MKKISSNVTVLETPEEVEEARKRSVSLDPVRDEFGPRYAGIFDGAPMPKRRV